MIDSLLNKIPLARWGWPQLLGLGGPLLVMALALVLAGGLWRWLALVPFVLLGLVIYFFRDPPRRVPQEPGLLVAPADGKIVEVTAIEHYEFFDRPAVKIGIFLSVLNVHINRSPCDGRVVEMHYEPGQFLNALNPASADQNEYMWIGFESLTPPHRRFVVRQVAGLISRRIVCELEPGKSVRRGEKFGMIKFGSRTELIVPADEVQVTAQVGQPVRGGISILARAIGAPEEQSG